MINSETELSRTTWRKSSRSGGGDQCVEVAQIGAARAVRKSQNPEGGHLALGAAYSACVKNGEYDL